MKLARLTLYVLLTLSLQIATALSYGDNDLAPTEQPTAQKAMDHANIDHSQMRHEAPGTETDMHECCPTEADKPCNEMPDCADMCATTASNACSAKLKQAGSQFGLSERHPGKTFFTPARLAAMKDILSDRSPKPPKA